MDTSLQQLLQRPDIWRPGSRPSAIRDGAPSGFPALDRLLYGDGWPRGALTELLTAHPGSGELRLLLPLLAELGRRRSWQLWIDPPFIPYAPALLQAGIDLEYLVIVRPGDRRQLLWVCAQALGSSGCGAVLCWPGTRPLRYAELRKLQVAAGSGHGCGFLLRDARAAAQASPSALRLQLEASAAGLSIQVLKQRGGNPGRSLLLPHTAALGPQLPLCEQPWVTGREAGAPLPVRRERHAPPTREVVWQ